MVGCRWLGGEGCESNDAGRIIGRKIMKLSIKFFALLLAAVFLCNIAPVQAKQAADAYADIGGCDYVPGEVVALADSLEEAQDIAAAYGIELKSYSWGVAVFTAPPAATDSKLRAMSVASDLPELCLNMIFTPFDDWGDGDGGIETQADGEAGFEPFSIFDAKQWHHGEMHTEQAWTLTRGEGVVVAVIDVGIDTTHPAFAGRISPLAYDAVNNVIGTNAVVDTDGHGTHVSGIIAANAYSSGGYMYNVYGVAPAVTILPIKMDYTMGAILRSIEYARENGADIINISFGTSAPTPSPQFIQQEIQRAVQAGVTVVCAAGNYKAGDKRYPGYVAYPAAYPEVIAVSATERGYIFDDSYSYYGPAIDFAAPGTDIYSTKKGGGFEFRNGTSMSSPNVTGVAALIKSMHPEYTPEQIRDVLRETATKVPSMGDAERDDYYGYGIVDAYAAIYSPPSPASVSVTGRVKTFNPRNPTTVRLMDGDAEMYVATIASIPSSEQIEQSFTFENVAPGNYTLVVTKPSHTSYTVQTIEVGNEDVDLTQDSRPAVRLMTLLCGDMNSDGMINDGDLTVLWMTSNYNKSTSDAANSLCDLNGDGMVNDGDLTILWMTTNYNKGRVIIP